MEGGTSQGVTRASWVMAASEAAECPEAWERQERIVVTMMIVTVMIIIYFLNVIH